MPVLLLRPSRHIEYEPRATRRSASSAEKQAVLKHTPLESDEFDRTGTKPAAQGSVDSAQSLWHLPPKNCLFKTFLLLFVV
jgi:hypothetical protein